MSSWPSGSRRARASAIAATWFSPERWSVYDGLLVLAVSPFLPWYSGNVHIGNSAAYGQLIEPSGTLRGFAVHEYLWALFGLGLLNLVLLFLHNAPERRAVTPPGFRVILIVTFALAGVIAVVAFVMKPHAWPGHLVFPPPFTFIIGWSYGAIAAVCAALLATGVAVAAARN